MVAECATRTEIPQGARAYFQPMLGEAMVTVKAEMHQEIGAAFDRSMQSNFNSLTDAMEENKSATKTFVENAMRSPPYLEGIPFST